MTSAGVVTLTDSTGAYTADLTHSAGVEFSGNNPLIIIPVPTDSSSTTTSGGAEAINLKMLTDNIIVSFSLTDSFGTFNMTSPSTNFEKLRYMFKYDSGTKTLVLGSTSIYCVIANLDINIAPGQLSADNNVYATGSMTLTVVNQN